MSIESTDLQTPQSDRIGQVVAGKYRLDSEIGSGGMGVVYKAYREDLQAYVALKLLRHSFMSDPQVVARFLQEARTAAGLKSPHVAHVLDFGVLTEDPAGAQPFIVMEYLLGEDLSDVLNTGQLPVGEAVDYIIQACHAIAEAHSHGIVHRDLKPANLFRHDRNGIKVLDFGIAKPGEASVSRLTKAGLSIGSPHYMSPEQIDRPGHVDGRADIYSFGICLYEMLTCRVPFNGETYGELVSSIMRGEAEQLARLRSDLPDGLAAVVHRAFARDANERFQKIEELVSALAPYSLPRSRRLVELLAVGGLSSITPTDFALPTPSTPPVFTSAAKSTPPPEAPSPTPRTRKRWLWAAAALLLLLMTAGVVSSATGSDPPEARAHVASLAPGAVPTSTAAAAPQPELALLAPTVPAPAESSASKHHSANAAKRLGTVPVAAIAESKLNLDSRSRQ